MENNTESNQSSTALLVNFPFDINKIQQNSYDLTKWYEHQTVSDLLEYEGINIGRLFYVEFHYFLLPFLKKFTELTKICEQYNKKHFIATFDLYDISKLLNSNTIPFDNDKKQENFLYDFIKLPVTNSFSFSIKRSHYQYL